MKTSDLAKKDNPFLASSQVVRAKRVSLVISLVVKCLLCLAIAFGVYAWLINEQLKLSMRQQADAVGQSLLMQTAERASELLAVDDKLGLNILLGSLAKNPLVLDVGVYNEQGVALYRAGLKQFTHLNKDDLYVERLNLPNREKLELHLRLNHQQFQLPWTLSVERAIIIAGVLLFVVLIIIFLFGRKIILPLIQLKEWVRYPVMPVPSINRGDEIGDLAIELQASLISAEDIEAYYAQFIPVEPEPEQKSDEEEKIAPNKQEGELLDIEFDPSFFDDIVKYTSSNLAGSEEVSVESAENSGNTVSLNVQPTIKTAVLCIRLGGQDKLKLLPKDRLISLLQRYRDCLDQTVRLYRGEIHTLSDGSSLILFHGRGVDADSYLAHSICCGELMRGLSHELQIELADTNITLLLQIALAQGTQLLGLTQKELLENETVKVVQALAVYSRNLLLIDQSIASDGGVVEIAKTRGLANPPDTFCIERVIEPYSELLEKQLRNMRNHKH